MAYYSHLDALYIEYIVLNISAVMRRFWLKINVFLSVIHYMALVKTKTKRAGMLMQTTKDTIIAT